MGSRLSEHETPEIPPAIARYRSRLQAILEAPLPLSGNVPNELNPRMLPVSTAARRVLTGFGDHIETMLGINGELRPISGIANKLPEHAARIAGVLALVRDIGAGEIDAAEMAAGVELAQYYAAEALRLDGGSRVSAELRLAQLMLDWLLSQWDEPAISLPDLYQRGPGAIRDGSTARKVATILEEHGSLIRIPDGAVIGGVRRREAWLIVRS